MHVTGEQLGQLTGIAAVLRFPLPEMEEYDESSDEVGCGGSIACLSVTQEWYCQCVFCAAHSV